MDIEKMLEFLKKSKQSQDQKPNESEEKPSESNLSFFPLKLRGRGLKMTSVDISKALPTFILGTISQSYTDEMWKKDVIQVGIHFNLDTEDETKVFLIKLISLKDSPTKMDTPNAIKQMEAALEKINTVHCIRIVRIGVSGSEFDFNAVSYLLKEWILPIGTFTKQMQFVTAGDTKNHTFLEFCKSLCVSGVCPEIEFYNTHDYHPFGDFKSKWYRI